MNGSVVIRPSNHTQSSRVVRDLWAAGRRTGRWLLLGALTLPAVGAAQTTAGPVRAVDVFLQIFGVDSSSLVAMMNGGSGTILAAVSGVVVTAAVAAALAIALFTFFVTLAQSAHEGKLGGRRYSMLWVPIRTALGLGFLTPVPAASGYCILQILVLWAASIGSGIADRAWDAGLGRLSNIPSSASAMGMSPQQSKAVVDGVFRNLVCVAKANASTDDPSTMLMRAEPKPITRETIYGSIGGPAPTGVTFKGGVGFNEIRSPIKSACGDLSVERTIAIGGDGQQNALNTAVLRSFSDEVGNVFELSARLIPVADQMVSHGMTQTAVREALIAADSEYRAAEKTRMAQYTSATQSFLGGAQAVQLTTAANGGWLNAGAWYMTISGAMDAVVDASVSHITQQPPRMEQLPASLQSDLRPAMQMAETATSDPTDASHSTAPVENNRVPGAKVGVPRGALTPNTKNDKDSKWQRLIVQPISDIFMDLFKWLTQSMIGTPGSDPILNLQAFGHAGLNVVETAALLVLVASLAPFAGFGLFMLSLPILIGFGLPFVLLAYYLPMIPYIFWVFGVLGWIMLLLEAVMIAPLWAAAHLLPEGEGVAGTSASQGWVLLMSLLARPVLMVAGLLASVVVMRFIAGYIAVGFDYLISSSMGSRMFGLVSMIAYSIALVALVIAAARRTFGLIHFIPDRALRFRGGAHESLGEAGGVGETQQSAAFMIAGGAVLGNALRAASNFKLPKKPGGDVDAPNKIGE